MQRWPSRLRVWHCRGCGVGQSSSSESIPGPGTSTSWGCKLGRGGGGGNSHQSRNMARDTLGRLSKVLSQHPSSPSSLPRKSTKAFQCPIPSYRTGCGPHPAALTSLGSWTEMQHLGLHTHPRKKKLRGNQSRRGSLPTLRFEKPSPFIPFYRAIFILQALLSATLQK